MNIPDIRNPINSIFFNLNRFMSFFTRCETLFKDVIEKKIDNVEVTVNYSFILISAAAPRIATSLAFSCDIRMLQLPS